jgi:hypothetical protein
MIKARQGSSSKLDAFVAGKLAQLAPKLAEGIREVGRQAAVELAVATFPDGDLPPSGALAAIARDICRVFATAGEIYGELKDRHGKAPAAAFYRGWRNGDMARARAVLRQVGGGFGSLEFGPVSAALHEAARSGPRRRVTLPFPIRIVPQAERDAYITQVQRRLGEAASGWSACAAALGGESGIPAWKSTSVHGSGRGSVVPLDGDRIGFVLRNHEPHARRNIGAGEVIAIAASARRRFAEILAG